MKTFKDYLSEDYSIFPKSEKDIDKLGDIKQDKSNLKKLYTHIQDKSSSLMKDPIAIDPKKGPIKVSRSVFHFLDKSQIKSDFGITINDGEGSRNSSGEPSGAEWEDLIVHAYNELNGSASFDSPEWVVAEKYWPLYGDLASKLAKEFKRKLKSKTLMRTGGGAGAKPKLSNVWGGKDATPKTDILGNSNERISLKKSGGSQLMSAKSKEAIATLEAAFMTMGEDSKFATKLTSHLEEKMGELVSKQTVTALKDKSEKGDKSAEVVDYEKLDKKHKELDDILHNYFNYEVDANKKLVRHVCFEAATGNIKFANIEPRANLMGKFDVKSGGVVVLPINNPDDATTKLLANNVKVYCAFKKGGSSSPAYSSLRLGLPANLVTEEQEIDFTFKDMVIEELSNAGLGMMLTEDVLQEGAFDILKRAGNWVKDKTSKLKRFLQSAMQKIKDKLKKVLSKIASLGKMMMNKLLNFLGLAVDSVQGIPKSMEI